MTRFESWLRAHVPFKEIGWEEIGEKFTRYQFLKTPWFNVYLHQLFAPNWHPQCHDHPWSFVAILLRRGYLERVPCPACNGRHTMDHKRFPGMILFRPAEFRHNVITPYGTNWSLVVTTAKSRDWGFIPCKRMVE